MHPYLNLRKIVRGSLPYSNASFHAVILIAVLTCIPQTGEQRRLLAEIRRILKDDGILYAADFLLNRDRRNVERYEKYRSRHEDYGVFETPGGGVFRHHSREHVEIVTAEFEKLTFEAETYTTMNGHESRGFTYIGRKRQKARVGA